MLGETKSSQLQLMKISLIVNAPLVYFAVPSPAVSHFLKLVCSLCQLQQEINYTP